MPMSVHADVEMQYVFAYPELFVQRDRRIVTVIRLNIYDPGAAVPGNIP